VTAGSPGELFATQFVSATQGWVVGQDAILATTDGGAHWTTQLSGQLNLTSVDFVNGQDGWAVGTTSLLATTDGGAVWTPLTEPCPVVSSVHFFSPADGYAVAVGALLVTSDGGHTWHPRPAPAGVQTACFSDAEQGFLGANGRLYRTSDGGAHWTVLTSSNGALGNGQGSVMEVECAGDGSAWALRVGPGAAMSQDPHVGYHADQSGATELFAEQYFQTPGATPTTESPGSDAGPFSALSPTAAVFIDNCVACGAGTAPWDLVTNSGATLAKEGNVGDITAAYAASFVSAQVGWVIGTELTFQSNTTRTQERVVATTDGGRTWHIQYAGPWQTSS
jgi:Photosynthesis system II assembly factor YCF48